jgi:competence protein ComEC
MKRRRTESRPRWQVVVALLAAAAALSLTWLVFRPAPALVTDFLDVGMGDSILMRVGREELLVDGGPDASVLSGLGESLPLLDRRIETVVVTHPHADHVTGLIYVLRRYEVGRLYYAAGSDTPEWRDLVRTAGERGVPMTKLAAGDEFRLGGETFDVLWPPVGYAPPKDDPNMYSAVIAAHREDGEAADLLLVGDATPEVEAALLEAGTVPPATVLKVAHHGSRFSSTAAFLVAARPKLAVIEVGKNSMGLPTWAAIARLAKAGAEVLRTDRDGHVRVTFDEAGDYHVTRGWFAAWPPVK